MSSIHYFFDTNGLNYPESSLKHHECEEKLKIFKALDIFLWFFCSFWTNLPFFQLKMGHLAFPMYSTHKTNSKDVVEFSFNREIIEKPEMALFDTFWLFSGLKIAKV